MARHARPRSQPSMCSRCASSPANSSMERSARTWARSRLLPFGEHPMPSTVDSTKQLTIDDVADLGGALISVADLHPLQFRTEQDFYSLVLAYLHGRVPAVSAEHSVKGGNIAFRLGGANPSVLEPVNA